MASRKDGARRRLGRTIAREARQLMKAGRALANPEAAPILRDLTAHVAATQVGPRPVTGLVRLPGIGGAATPRVDAEHARAAALATSLRTHAALERAGASMKRLRARAPRLSLGTIAQRPADPRVDRVIARRLGRRGAEIVAMARRLTPSDIVRTYGLLSFDEVLDRFDGAAADQHRHAVQPLQTLRGSPGGDGPTIGTLKDDGTKYFVSDGDKTTEVSGSTWWLILLTLGLVSLIGWIADNIEDWFNETDDDIARAEIEKLDCKGIVALDDNHWLVAFGAMIDGPTGDEDERAMIKVLGCLPNDRVKTLVNHFGLSNFLDEFQGVEFDAVTVVLALKGMLKVSDWDDDATRLFINTVSTQVLAVAAVSTIVQLCRNMFEGSCGDEDENAILRLLKAQDLCKVKQVLKQISFDEFDDNVDGSEWDKLSTLLNAAKHASC